MFTNLGVLIKFELGSWLKKNNRLYEQGAVRPINLGGVWWHAPQKILKSGGSEMPFSAFWAPNYHASTSGNYSLCMAIRCEIKLKKNIPASTAILGTVQTTLLTKREGCICTRKCPVTFLIFHPFQCLFSFPANPQFSGKTF